MIRLLDRDPPNLLVRELAAMRLRHGGDEARAAIPTLRALLAEHYPDNPTPETLALRESASHVNPHYLSVVASALLALSPDDAALVWTHRLVDGRRGERLRAALALGHLGAGAQGAVRYLITAARCDEPRVAAEAITALGMIGVPAAHAVPLFEELVRHDDAQIRTRAQAALRQVRGS
jgi:HEAT repeat protein